MANKQEYVDLGLSCAKTCKALERGMDGRKLNELSKSTREAISELETWVDPTIHAFCSFAHRDVDRRAVAEIHKEVEKLSGRSRFSRFLHSRSDKEAIPGWNSKLDRILRVFNVCSARSRLVSLSLITPFPGRSGREHQRWRCGFGSGHVENWSGCVKTSRKQWQSE